MLRVNIEVSSLEGQKLTGVGVYIMNLIKALRQRPDITLSASYKISRYRYFKTIRDKVDLPFEIPHIPYIYKFIPHKYDIFHGPDYWVPGERETRKVVTIHDFSAFHEGLWDKSNALKGRNSINKLLTKSNPDQIIVVSDFTKNELIERFPQYENRVTSVYNGADHLVRLENIQKPFDFPYITCVGTIEKRKNVLNLGKAFQKISSKFPDIKLVLVGGTNGHMGREIAGELVKIPNVIYLDYVSNEMLQSIVRNAEFLAYPSVYEGFGFPILEAMYLGAPVLTSDFGAMKEVSGGHAFTADTTNIDTLAQALEHMIMNESQRKRLSNEGIEYVKQFTWQKTIEQTINVYKKALM